jgi:hypothetical protein
LNALLLDLRWMIFGVNFSLGGYSKDLTAL